MWYKNFQKKNIKEVEEVVEEVVEVVEVVEEEVMIIITRTTVQYSNNNNNYLNKLLNLEIKLSRFPVYVDSFWVTLLLDDNEVVDEDLCSGLTG